MSKQGNSEALTKIGYGPKTRESECISWRHLRAAAGWSSKLKQIIEPVVNLLDTALTKWVDRWT